jgi:hypothetical protein
MKPLKFVALLILVAATVHAFDEPTEFRGLRFTESIKSQIPKCPYGLGLSDRNFKEKCWHDPIKDAYLIDNLGPIADVRIMTVAGEVDEKLGYLYLTFNSSSFNTLLSVLRERYGPPTDIQETKWTSKAGRTLPNTLATWQGENIHIRARQLGSKIDESQITVSTKAWRDKSSQENQGKIKDAAKGL